jgi:hypothetical protein
MAASRPPTSRGTGHQSTKVIDSPSDRLKPAPIAVGSRNQAWNFHVSTEPGTIDDYSNRGEAICLHAKPFLRGPNNRRSYRAQYYMRRSRSWPSCRRSGESEKGSGPGPWPGGPRRGGKGGWRGCLVRLSSPERHAAEPAWSTATRVRLRLRKSFRAWRAPPRPRSRLWGCRRSCNTNRWRRPSPSSLSLPM